MDQHGPPGATFAHFGCIFGHLAHLCIFMHFYEHLCIFNENSWENNKNAANCSKNNEYCTKTQKRSLEVRKNAPRDAKNGPASIKNECTLEAFLATWGIPLCVFMHFSQVFVNTFAFLVSNHGKTTKIQQIAVKIMNIAQKPRKGA